MPLNTVYHPIAPSCVLAIPKKDRTSKSCECEGKPHAEDWVKVKPKFSYGEKLDLAAMMSQGPAQGLCWMIARGVVEWSLKDTTERLVNPIEGAKGEPLPITEAVIYDLDEDTADFLSGLWDKGAGETADPKSSSGADAPSPSS